MVPRGHLSAQNFQITPVRVDHRELENAVKQVQIALGGG